ncbi:hypothetical protein Taro_042191 [Colocasia esculenta]|uniref:Uncharacterized protein n=1 Tax=Colocasia esculenta TaxID=4460 RepID=A0A843WVS9_COLES|nr:hypothetical protein [Colocasia esculenta]
MKSLTYVTYVNVPPHRRLAVEFIFREEDVLHSSSELPPSPLPFVGVSGASSLETDAENVISDSDYNPLAALMSPLLRPKLIAAPWHPTRQQRRRSLFCCK